MDGPHTPQFCVNGPLKETLRLHHPCKLVRPLRNRLGSYGTGEPLKIRDFAGCSALENRHTQDHTELPGPAGSTAGFS